jgi:hypothetical protein
LKFSSRTSARLSSPSLASTWAGAPSGFRIHG